MSTPILLANVLNIQTALRGIAAADQYHYTVQETSVVLDAVALDTVASADLPFFVVGHKLEPVMKEYRSKTESVQEIWRIWITARIDAEGAGSETARKITAITQLLADVEKALFSDFGHAAWWGFTRGGHAMETKLGQHLQYTGLPGDLQCYVEIPVDIRFQRAVGTA